MKGVLAICCIIVASLFVSTTRAALCETLTLKVNSTDKTATELVNLWVNASITAYAGASFGTFFQTINDTSRAAHVNYYGSLIGCTGLPAPTSGDMSAVHSTSTISAADFNVYVELTRTALQSAVTSMSVGEITEFYKIFEAFRVFNSSNTICNQAGCQTPPSAIALSGTANPLSFDKAYIATSATSLTVDNNSADDAELYYVLASDVDCAAKAVLASVGPEAIGQPLDLPFTSSGVYYIFDTSVAETECFVSSTDFSDAVLVLDYTFVEVPPTPEPVAVPEEPVAPPVSNDTAPVEAPVSPPVSNVTAPVESPVEPPVQPPVEPPTTPIAEPVAVVPIAEPQVEVPVATPVAVPVNNITPAAAEEGFSAGGYIAGIVILVLIVIGLLIAVIVMGVKLRRNSTVVVA